MALNLSLGLARLGKLGLLPLLLRSLSLRLSLPITPISGSFTYDEPPEAVFVVTRFTECIITWQFAL